LKSYSYLAGPEIVFIYWTHRFITIFTKAHHSLKWNSRNCGYMSQN